MNGLSMSHPSRGAWIEIYDLAVIMGQVRPSHPSRGAWIEIFCWLWLH